MGSETIPLEELTAGQEDETGGHSIPIDVLDTLLSAFESGDVDTHDDTFVYEDGWAAYGDYDDDEFIVVALASDISLDDVDDGVWHPDAPHIHRPYGQIRDAFDEYVTTVVGPPEGYVAVPGFETEEVWLDEESLVITEQDSEHVTEYIASADDYHPDAPNVPWDVLAANSLPHKYGYHIGPRHADAVEDELSEYIVDEDDQWLERLEAAASDIFGYVEVVSTEDAGLVDHDALLSLPGIGIYLDGDVESFLDEWDVTYISTIEERDAEVYDIDFDADGYANLGIFVRNDEE